MRARPIVLCAAAAALLLLAAPRLGPAGGVAEAASFDCARAATASDRAICANPGLSALDGQLGTLFAQRVAADPALRQLQRGWIAARTAGCGGAVGCLTSLTSAQIAFLRSGAAQPPAALPHSAGACSLTRITAVGTRLENQPGSGSAVSEANGGSQVSYDQIPAIDAARAGDAALVCLVSIPRHCPPGDARGRVYAVADLRTLRAWSQADSEHSCGGA
ncbi:MAG TPA: lysozyme inhibitor LprI family protein [Caulobacteraceae bacterium]|jgi:uncharacterized protein